eukprot:IDg1007t1
MGYNDSDKGALAKLLLNQKIHSNDSEDMDKHPYYAKYEQISHRANEKLNEDLNYENLIAGQEDPKITEECLEKAINSAIQNGLPVHLHETLRNLVKRFRDIFRTKLGSDEPAKFDPLVIKLVKDSKPVRVKMLCEFGCLPRILANANIQRITRIMQYNNTRWSVYPTRVLQGLTNAASYFQSSISGMYADSELQNSIIQWIDDILIHSSSAENNISALETQISSQGVRMDPRCLDAL